MKGHIAVAINDLNKIKKGYQIDKKARLPLNEIGLDYGHGTGHVLVFFQMFTKVHNQYLNLTLLN